MSWIKSKHNSCDGSEWEKKEWRTMCVITAGNKKSQRYLEKRSKITDNSTKAERKTGHKLRWMRVRDGTQEDSRLDTSATGGHGVSIQPMNDIRVAQTYKRFLNKRYFIVLPYNSSSDTVLPTQQTNNLPWTRTSR